MPALYTCYSADFFGLEAERYALDAKYHSTIASKCVIDVNYYNTKAEKYNIDSEYYIADEEKCNSNDSYHKIHNEDLLTQAEEFSTYAIKYDYVIKMYRDEEKCKMKRMMMNDVSCDDPN